MAEFTAKEIASIIRACKSSGVTELDYNGLQLKFTVNTYTEDSSSQLNTPDTINQGIVYTDELNEDVYQDHDLEELRKHNLMLEDPLAYEKEMTGSG